MKSGMTGGASPLAHHSTEALPICYMTSDCVIYGIEIKASSPSRAAKGLWWIQANMIKIRVHRWDNRDMSFIVTRHQGSYSVQSKALGFDTNARGERLPNT